MGVYATLKQVHASLAIASGLGLLARGILAIRGSALTQHWAARVAPHVLDTLLLATGVSLAFVLALSPLATPWLAAKLGAVLAYIVAGSLAVKRARSTLGRGSALVVAGALFAYVLAVVLAHDPTPWT